MKSVPPTRKPISRIKNAAPKKKFTAKKWTSEGEGKKVLLYGDFGMGKTTLASMLPKPIFIGVDDGGRMIVNPLTNEHLTKVDGITTFADVRDVLQQADVFHEYDTIVIDTITDLEKLALPYTFSHVPGPKGSTCQNIEAYGYNKGYRHLYDTMRLILQDCEPLVRAGKSIVFIAQNKNIKVANPAGEDYLREAPSLFSGNTTAPSVIDAYCEWVDYVLRIGYSLLAVKDKKAAGNTDRTIYTEGEVYFIAKHRTPLDAEIPFSEPSDRTIWEHIFDETN